MRCLVRVLGTLTVLTTLSFSQTTGTKPKTPPSQTKQSVAENENVKSFKYQLADRIRQLLDPQAMGPDGRARAAQELANMKARAQSFSQQFDKGLAKFYRAEALAALRRAATDADEMVRQEAALASKLIQDDSPFPKVSNGSNWVQIQEFSRGGGTGGAVFGTAQSSDVLLEVTFKTDDPSITFSELSKRAGNYCAVMHSGSTELRLAEAGGGDFNNPLGSKICFFAIPQQARGVRFRLKGFPEADLRF